MFECINLGTSLRIHGVCVYIFVYSSSRTGIKCTHFIKMHRTVRLTFKHDVNHLHRTRTKISERFLTLRQDI